MSHSFLSWELFTVTRDARYLRKFLQMLFFQKNWLWAGKITKFTKKSEQLAHMSHLTRGREQIDMLEQVVKSVTVRLPRTYVRNVTVLLT